MNRMSIDKVFSLPIPHLPGEGACTSNERHDTSGAVMQYRNVIDSDVRVAAAVTVSDSHSSPPP